jgi:hypothetical protein
MSYPNFSSCQTSVYVYTQGVYTKCIHTFIRIGAVPTDKNFIFCVCLITLLPRLRTAAEDKPIVFFKCWILIRLGTIPISVVVITNRCFVSPAIDKIRYLLLMTEARDSTKAFRVRSVAEEVEVGQDLPLVLLCYLPFHRRSIFIHHPRDGQPDRQKL